MVARSGDSGRGAASESSRQSVEKSTNAPSPIESLLRGPARTVSTAMRAHLTRGPAVDPTHGREGHGPRSLARHCQRRAEAGRKEPGSVCPAWRLGPTGG